MRRLVWVALALGGLLLARSAVFTVDRSEYVYLTQFGRHVATYDGADDARAGLYFKWPWPVQEVRRLDRRLQTFDLPGAELMTRDPQARAIDKTLTLDAYVCWRIADADGVDRFVRSVRSADEARALLAQRVGSELGAAVGEMVLDDLVSTESLAGPDGQPLARVDAKREELRLRLLYGGGRSADEARPGSLYAVARDQYGIEVVDVRLRRTNHPTAVRQAIFERIRSERERKTADYESEGERLAEDIRSASARRVSKLKARAEAEAVRLRGQADARADAVRLEAQAQNPELYAFLKKLEAYQRVLGDNKTLLLLSTHRELFGTLFDPPGPGRKPKAPEVMPKEGGM